MTITSGDPNHPQLPRLDECLSVQQGFQTWTEEQTRLRDLDPAFKLQEAEACIVLASLKTSKQDQQKVLKDSIRLIQELPTQELRDIGLECLHELIPARLRSLLSATICDESRVSSDSSPEVDDERRNPEEMKTQVSTNQTVQPASVASSATTTVVAPNDDSKSRRLRRSSLIRICSACCLGLIGFGVVSMFRSDPVETSQFFGELSGFRPDGTVLTKDAAITANFGDRIEFRGTLVSEKRHRWGLRMNDREARWVDYVMAPEGTSEFLDRIELDAGTCIEFFVMIAADEPLPEMPAEPPRSDAGVVVNWLTEICPDLQNLGGTDISGEAEQRTLTAIRKTGFAGSVEVHVKHFFHSGSPGQRQL